MVLNYRDVADIVRLIDASACDEFVLETADFKLIVRRGAGAAAAGAPASSPAGPPNRGPATDNPDSGARTTAAPDVAEVGVGQIAVRAPMVGTFYRAPAPDAPPFVEVGTRVRAGAPLCLIEVMKLFTTIEAEAAGTIAEIAVDDGILVEHGQILFLIDTQADA